MVTLTPSSCVGRLFPKKSELPQTRVVPDRVEPRIVIQLPGPIPERKLAPFTTELTVGIAGPRGFTNTHAAPIPPLSKGPPSMAVVPSADNATARPSCAPPTAPAPTSLLPSWLHTPAMRVYIQAAPAEPLSR